MTDDKTDLAEYLKNVGGVTITNDISPRAFVLYMTSVILTFLLFLVFLLR